MQQIIQWLDQYLDHVTQFLYAHVVLAPLLLIFAEEMGIPILVPGDFILGYVGFRLSQGGSVGLWEAFIVAVISVLGGSSILFFVARRWGRQALNKLSRFIFLKESHLERAEKLFDKYGVWAIIFGRHIPGLRIPITIFAASSGVKYPVFISATAVSTVFWILFYLTIGKRFGGNVQHLIVRYSWLSFWVLVGAIGAVLTLHFYGQYRERIREAERHIDAYSKRSS